MKRYLNKISKRNHKYYSLNFLIAELGEIPELQKDLIIMEKHLFCEIFETRDFTTRSYYKNVSSCVKNLTDD